MSKSPATANEIQRGISSTRNERDACLAAFIARGGAITAHSTWTLVLRLRTSAGIANITDATVPSGTWPPDFDREIKDCYVSSFRTISFATEQQIDLRFEYPMSVYPNDRTSEALP